MKIILYAVSLIFFTITIGSSAENSCSGLKKLSKEYIACKAGNLKKAIAKKSQKSSSKSGKSSDTNKKVKDGAKKVGEGAKKVGKSIKKTGNKITKFLSGFGPKNKNK
tara:strand:- start:141 stop:464 length:324 start_codon:yes stop_codon:yes gene_type:complete